MPAATRMIWNAPQRSRSRCQLSGSVPAVHVTICLTIGTSISRPFSAAAYAAGSQNVQTDPPSARGLIRIAPPWASTISRHMGRPRPAPGRLLP
jgi:hypothetical protein